MPLVSISDGQRAPISNANVVATVYHGLPVDLHPPTFNPRGGYLAFLGRISPEKGVDRAIKVAQTVYLPLKIAAKVDRAERAGRSRLTAYLNAFGWERGLARSERDGAIGNDWTQGTLN
jgi:glycosyltransferase involved in cell wall biosynthesis